MIAIEPNPEICVDLLFNRRLNGFEKTIRVVLAAANEKDSLLKIGIPASHNRGMSREQSFEAEVIDGYFVPGLRSRQNIQGHVHFVRRCRKNRRGGSELRVLIGLFRDCTIPPPKHIIFEFIPDHFQYGDSPTELLNYLRDQRSITDDIRFALQRGKKSFLNKTYGLGRRANS